jgi:hypothetical protein
MKFIVQRQRGQPSIYVLEVGQSMELNGKYYRLASETTWDGCIDLKNADGHPCKLPGVWSEQSKGFIVDPSRLVNVPFLPSEIRNAEEVAEVISVVPLNVKAVEGAFTKADGQAANG